MMTRSPFPQPFQQESKHFLRRDFLKMACTTAAGPLIAGAIPSLAVAAPDKSSIGNVSAESLVKILHESLSPEQKQQICFDWNHQDQKRGLLRTFLSNNWKITKPAVKSNFYTTDQQHLIYDIFKSLIVPEWHSKYEKQFRDDMGGFGKRHAIALFGEPDEGPFEFVLTGRHGTYRCDGDSAPHVAFGGPILYGHAASGYFEKDTHPGNIFWEQALAANNVYQMLSGKQQQTALKPEAPDEAQVGFRGSKGEFPGIPVSDLSVDQREHLQKVLRLLLAPFRQSDKDEVVAALKANGGLDRCSLAFYRRDDMGSDGIWDNWRLEGPAFVWHWRGAPHVHAWVNVSADASVKTNTKNNSGPLRR